jgi:hypothetical protein
MQSTVSRTSKSMLASWKKPYCLPVNHFPGFGIVKAYGGQ